MSAAFWAKNEDLGQCAIVDFDRDMDIWAEMEDWLHRSCRKLISSGHIKVGYVKEEMSAARPSVGRAEESPRTEVKWLTGAARVRH